MTEEIVGYVDPSGEGNGNWSRRRFNFCAACNRYHPRHQAVPFEPERTTLRKAWGMTWRFVLGMLTVYVLVAEVLILGSPN